MEPGDLERYAFVPRPGAVPAAIARAEGAYLYTADGTAILDAAGGAIAVNVGHGRPEVADAVARALRETSYVVPVFATEGRVALVDRLRERWLPPSLTRAYFASGGSEAMDAAIRLSRQHFTTQGETRRWKIIGRDLSYHGTTVATLAAGGHAGRRTPFGPMLYDWPKAPACYCLRCPLERSYPSCGVACVDAVDALIQREGPETVAAVVAEPIVGSTAGALVPPDEYWPRLAKVCRRHGVLLVVDEVMTGFGRTGVRFAVEHWGVEPDVLVAGKGLAGGYAPICGVFASERVMAPLAAAGEDVMFYTYGAHPSACAAADTVLEIIEREDLVRRAAQQGEKLRKRLEALEDHPHVGEIRGRGLMWGIEFVKDRASLEPFPAEAGVGRRVVGYALGEGVFFYPAGSGPVRDAIMIGPPFTIGDAEIDRIGAALEVALDKAVAQAG
ncbi:MAG: aspartate aminotransferase family protein [Myxococcota bacterium]